MAGAIAYRKIVTMRLRVVKFANEVFFEKRGRRRGRYNEV